MLLLCATVCLLSPSSLTTYLEIELLNLSELDRFFVVQVCMRRCWSLALAGAFTFTVELIEYHVVWVGSQAWR